MRTESAGMRLRSSGQLFRRRSQRRVLARIIEGLREIARRSEENTVAHGTDKLVILVTRGIESELSSAGRRTWRG